MKKQCFYLLPILLFVAILPARAQLRQIPSVVTDSFTAKYPGASNVAWKDKVTNFEAKFNLSDNAELDARFSSSGHWENTEKKISADNLPAAVKSGISMGEFSAWPITSAYILYRPESEKTYHITVAKNDVDKRNLLFDGQGKLLQDKFTL